MSIHPALLKTSLAAVGLLAISAATSAHHGVGAQFDLSQTIEMEGEVRKLIWRNPHVRFTVAVADPGGAGRNCGFIAAQSLSMMRSRDITEKLLAVGDTIQACRQSRERGFKANVRNQCPSGRWP